MKQNYGLFVLLFLLIQAGAKAATDQVCYTPISGVAMTMCTPKFDGNGDILSPCPEMLGKFQLVMTKVSTGPGQRRLRLKGPMHGSTNPDQTLNHVLGDDHTRGLLYTFGDSLLEANPLDECLIQVKEELYVGLGTGKFSGANGKITVIGELNTCTGTNEFDIELNQDLVCFDPAAFNRRPLE